MQYPKAGLYLGFRAAVMGYLEKGDEALVALNEYLKVRPNLKKREDYKKIFVPNSSLADILIEGLVKAGAFDNINPKRQSLFESIPNFILKTKNIHENKIANQIDQPRPIGRNTVGRQSAKGGAGEMAGDQAGDHHHGRTHAGSGRWSQV